MSSLHHSASSTAHAADLNRLSEAVAHECVLVENTVFGITYFADEFTGEVFNIPTAELPAPEMDLGQRIRFQITGDDRIVNLQALL